MAFGPLTGLLSALGSDQIQQGQDVVSEALLGFGVRASQAGHERMLAERRADFLRREAEADAAAAESSQDVARNVADDARQRQVDQQPDTEENLIQRLLRPASRPFDPLNEALDQSQQRR